MNQDDLKQIFTKIEYVEDEKITAKKAELFYEHDFDEALK